MTALCLRLEILMYDTFEGPMEHYIERCLRPCVSDHSVCQLRDSN